MNDQHSETLFSFQHQIADIPIYIFSWLDSSSLALAACVCQSWCDIAREVRGKTKKLFQLVLADLVHTTPTLVWAMENLNKKQLPQTLCEKLCELAAERGALTSLQWAHANGYPWNKQVCSKAASNGHLTTLQWARTNGCNWGLITCSNAAYGGHLEVLQWARTNGCPWIKTSCYKAAQEKNHKETAAWIAAQLE